MNGQSLRATSGGLLVALVLTPVVGAADRTPVVDSTTRPVVVEVRGNSFHWGDAAVGAAATLGLVLAGLGVRTTRTELHNGKEPR